MMRVAIVNDLSLAVQVLKRSLEGQPGVEVAWVALDGAEAVEKCLRDTPDVVLMDLIMPVMDGVEATRRIMLQSPCAVLVVTATVEGHAAKVFEAMGHGALDAVATPVLAPGGAIDGAEELLCKLRTVAAVIGKHFEPAPEGGGSTPAIRPRKSPPLVAVGSSTGGPTALATMLAALPPTFPAGIVVAQHVDNRFAKGLAQWLDAQCGLTVRMAEHGDRVEKGLVLVAGGDRHLVMGPERTLRYTALPENNPYKPSVDVLFQSLVEARHPPGAAVLLTGMGRDGAKGMAALKSAGWTTIAQDEATSVVWGMPGAAVALNAARRVLPLEEIGPALEAMF